jgi:lipopolysaccharide transport system ATP-binding protein
MPLAIKVENVSKAYQLGEFTSGTLSRDLERWWALYRGKEDPFLKVGETNDRSSKGKSDIVWSLKDLNFEIQQGDAVGIIGKNGAGKSTLLKVLSQVTSPTTGSIKLKGRIASLLEVGTGFHPELTGRENVYLNGAILGMRKHEISKKFDEIVDFSGVERYIDTPVKRYSSGMYVRLAFAVAAHLESEILIVDEVLAVGDAEFQNKCIGKMGAINKGEGRTILFVSHNMASIQNLCKSSLLMSKGQFLNQGKTNTIINEYLVSMNSKPETLAKIKDRKGNQDIFFLDGKVEGINTDSLNSIESFNDFSVTLEYRLNQIVSIVNYRIDIGINNNLGDRVAWLSSNNINQNFDLVGESKIQFVVKNCPLSPGSYTCNIYAELNNNTADWLVNVLPFNVVEKDYYNTGRIVPPNQGNILLNYSLVEDAG